MSDPDPILENALAVIMEHYDSARIVATRASDDGSRCTIVRSAGGGNFNAQMDSVREWYQGQLAYQQGYQLELGRLDARGE